ncbi:MAG: type II secretion system F family protein [Candidatus Eremiobacterota bacterium]
MPNFQYKALDAEGKYVDGEHSAEDRDSLVANLRAQGLTVVHVEEKQAPAPTESGTARKGALRLSMGVSRKDITVLTRQLATTLHAGLPLLRIIHVLHRECSHPGLKSILEQLGQSIQRGRRFSDALGEHPRVFDDTYVNMIRVGETGGNLPDCVARLATMMEKEMALRNKVRSAMTYPVFVLIFTAAMTYALIGFLMPMFTPMFADSGLDIPRDYPLTDFLIQASQFATDPASMAILVGLMVALGVGFKIASGSPTGRYSIDLVKFNFPYLTGFIRMVAAARFSRNFSILLKSGVNLVQALTLVAAASGNLVVSRIVNRAAKSIQEGASISKTLKATGIFPDLMIQMAAMGEEAGTLPDMLERCADYFDDEIDTSVTAMTALLEPGMMVLIGSVVAVFVMGVLLPVLGISTGQMNKL